MIPYTDHECRLVLDEIYCGDKIVIPSSDEHARNMIKVAQTYLNESKKDMWADLKGKE